jgi:glycine/D-amino acid oxidase-like deaminating enzyme
MASGAQPSPRARTLAAELRQTAGALIAVVEGIEPAFWSAVRKPGEWSPGKDAEHAADAAAMHFGHVCLALGVAHPDPPVIERKRLTAVRSQADIVEQLRSFADHAAGVVECLTDAQLDLPAQPPRHPPRTVADIVARPLIRHLGAHREEIELKLRAAARRQAPRRRGAVRERVAIVGGGVSGALTAARLAERGFDVILLEKESIGNGSSSRSMAGIRAQFGVAETVVGMLFSEWWYVHFHSLLRTPSELQQPVIKQNGYLFLYDHPAANDAAPEAKTLWTRAQANVTMQRTAGLKVDLLTPEDVKERWPHLDTERLVGATWCPSDGFLFPPVIYGEGVRRASELGARIAQRTAVVGARARGERIAALETTSGLVEVDRVVNCTNAWAPRVSATLGGMPLSIEPVKRFLYHLDPNLPARERGAVRQLPMTIYGMGRPLGSHTRPEGEHLILAGMSETPPEPVFEDAEQDLVPAPFDHRNGVDNFGFRLLSDMAMYAPRLAESAGLLATTCGYYGMTPDAVPLIGFDRQIPNLVHAAGFSGHGVMHAPITALLVEALVAGDVQQGRVRLPPPFEAHCLDLAAFDPARDFTRTMVETAVL